MAYQIPDLVELTIPANDDYLIVRDTSETIDKKVTFENLLASVPLNFSIADSTDFTNTTGVAADGYAIVWDNNTSKFILTLISDSGGSGGSPGGFTTQVQFNSAGAFAGDSGMTYDAANDALTVAGRVVTPIIRPASDSTTAFKVQNAAGTRDLITADTTNNRVVYNIRNGATPTAPSSLGGLVVTGYASNEVGILAQSALEFPSASYAFMAKTGAGVTIFSVDARFGTIYTAANFGIGITPAAPIHINNSTNDSLRLEGAYAANYMYFKNTDADWTIGRDRATSNGFHIAESSSLMTSTRLSILSSNGRVGIQQVSPTAFLDVPASITASASLRIRSGTAPTSPNDGDVWNNGNSLAVHINGTNAVDTDGGLSVWMQSSINPRKVGCLLWRYIDKTDATRITEGSLTAYYQSTEHKAVRWRGGSAGPLLSFYDVVTPIARQTLATGAGASVDDVITALQNLGLLKQS